MVYLILIIAILLILVVLVQNSKGGGLVSNAGANQVMGVRKTADFLEKATWTLAGAVILLSIVTGMVSNSRNDNAKKARTDEEVTTTATDDVNYISRDKLPQSPVEIQTQQPAEPQD